LIRLVETLRFRCLKYVRRRMNRFHVLVGPNGSGKTTFLDVVAFLGDLVSSGLEKAIFDRSEIFEDLLWNRSGNCFELAVEIEIPSTLKGNPPYKLVRYEICVGFGKELHENHIQSEKVLLKKSDLNGAERCSTLFPETWIAPESILTQARKGTKTVVNKVLNGNDNFYDETGKGWDHAFKLGPLRSALANLPEDESRFPIASWLKRFLMTGIQRVVLRSDLMRKPSPPGQPVILRPDGSNLAWMIEDLREKHRAKFNDWIQHLRMALPDLIDIETVLRPEDRHRYIVLRYGGDLRLPSWVVSDGTLRLLALTLPAYIPDLKGAFLIEEPENGIHPRALEIMLQSLSSIYDAQVLLATHSPVLVGIADLSDVLCFAKTEEGATDIVNGMEHPLLKDWRGETDLGVLFAGGVLG